MPDATNFVLCLKLGVPTNNLISSFTSARIFLFFVGCCCFYSSLVLPQFCPSFASYQPMLITFQLVHHFWYITCSKAISLESIQSSSFAGKGGCKTSWPCHALLEGDQLPDIYWQDSRLMLLYTRTDKVRAAYRYNETDSNSCVYMMVWHPSVLPAWLI